MNHEELKMILDTISTVSDDASTAAIWWMALHYGGSLLSGAMWIAGLVTAVGIVAAAFTRTNEWAEIGRAAVRAAGQPVDRYDPVYSRHRTALDEAIRKIKS